MAELFDTILPSPLVINSIVIDNFYENPVDVRNYALTQNYTTHHYHPGTRTNNLIMQKELYDNLNELFLSYNLNIVSIDHYFQSNTADNFSWVHHDKQYFKPGHYSYAGIIYLTPNAPINSGTCLYKHRNGFLNGDDAKRMNMTISNDQDGTNMNKWTIVNNTGNIFNRLYLYNSSNYHTAVEYFGNNFQDCRLMQLLFICVTKPK